jgi:hypothetical protein
MGSADLLAKDDTERDLRYIEVQWADIFHSRNQDWISLAILAVLTFGASIEPSADIKALLLTSAAVTSFLGILQADRHWWIRDRKLALTISRYERELGLTPPRNPKHWFPVQGAFLVSYSALMLMYSVWSLDLFMAFPTFAGVGLIVGAAIAAILFSIVRAQSITDSIFETKANENPAPVFTTVPGASGIRATTLEAVGGAKVTAVKSQAGAPVTLSPDSTKSRLFIYVCESSMAYNSEGGDGTTSKTGSILIFADSNHTVRFDGSGFCFETKGIKLPFQPMVADFGELEACLKILGDRPLKLIADRLYPDERRWSARRWSFQRFGGGSLKKDLLVNRQDHFQFSVAGSASHQDFHYHSGSYESLATSKGLSFISSESGRLVSNEAGEHTILTFPPNVKHEVRLGEITFVFQASVASAKIHADKTVVPRV